MRRRVEEGWAYTTYGKGLEDERDRICDYTWKAGAGSVYFDCPARIRLTSWQDVSHTRTQRGRHETDRFLGVQASLSVCRSSICALVPMAPEYLYILFIRRFACLSRRSKQETRRQEKISRHRNRIRVLSLHPGVRSRLLVCS